jgi:esterase/lipase superfamily enzyme
MLNMLTKGTKAKLIPEDMVDKQAWLDGEKHQAEQEERHREYEDACLEKEEEREADAS